jgi:uncharacterized protein YaeQ
MALPATIYRLHIDLSDVDRSVYESLDLRVAQHPSETLRSVLTRVLAYCLGYEKGIAFTRGLAEPDEPALCVRDPQGALRAWIDVGVPSAERLHKASKAAPRVVVFTHDPEALARAARARPIHRAADLEVHALDPALLEALEETMERTARWELVRTEGQIYLTVAGRTLAGTVTRIGLG